MYLIVELQKKSTLMWLAAGGLQITPLRSAKARRTSHLPAHLVIAARLARHQQ
jgi:hypothetical protein